MNILAIETTAAFASTAVIDNDECVHEAVDKGNFTHLQRLIPLVDQVLEECGMKLEDIDGIAVSRGPGSFTGIRIGISTVKGLCFAANKPCLPVTSFDTIAYNIRQGKVMAIIDALHGAYYVCGYENGKIVFPPEFIGKDELLSLKEEYTFLSGKKIDGVETEVVSIVDGFIKAIENKKNEITFDAEKLVPLYIRKSQAEEGR